MTIQKDFKFSPRGNEKRYEFAQIIGTDIKLSERLMFVFLDCSVLTFKLPNGKVSSSNSTDEM